MVVEQRIVELRVYGDSQLVINQINNEYQTKDDNLMPYKRMVDDFKQYFVHITFEQIPGLDNRVVDAMATITSLLQIPDKQSHYEFLVDQLFSLVYDNSAFQLIYALTGLDSPLYGTIYDYLKRNTLPLDPSHNQKRSFIWQATRYTLTTYILYY